MEIISKCIYKEEYDTSVSLSMVIRSKLTLNEIYRHFDYSCGCEHDCCGCWNILISDQSPSKPYAQCNECGELRAFKAEGIEDGQWLTLQKEPVIKGPVLTVVTDTTKS